MEAEQGRAEHGHEVGDGRVAAAHHGDQEAESHGEQGYRQSHSLCRRGRLRTQSDDADGDGHEVHAVESARHGDVAASYPTEDEDEQEVRGKN